MPRSYLTTTQVARAVGVHPNTVRLYEEWNFIPPVPRAANGYRMFSQAHIDHMRLARLAMRFTWMGGDIRRITLDVVYRAADGDLPAASQAALALQASIQRERAYALAAVEVLEQWASAEQPVDKIINPLTIKEAARLLDVTPDMLRSWERNGLIRVPRDPHSRYRRYHTPEIARLRVIRTLRKAGYSLMSILRMILAFEEGERDNLRVVLDTPRPDDEVFVATDHWLSTLAELDEVSQEILDRLGDMIVRAESSPER